MIKEISSYNKYLYSINGYGPLYQQWLGWDFIPCI